MTLSKKYKNTAGWLLIIGGFLNLTRMIPVMAGLKKPPEFPLETAEQLINFITPNYSGHAISHLMAMAGFLFIIFGIRFLLDSHKESGFPILSSFVSICGYGGFGLFFIATIFDGFVLHKALRSIDVYGEDAYMLIEIVHSIAINFFSIALLLIFIAIGFLSQINLHTTLFKKRLGYFGLIVGHFSSVAFILGLFGRYWEEPLGGIFIMLSFLFWLILGVSLLRLKTES